MLISRNYEIRVKDLDVSGYGEWTSISGNLLVRHFLNKPGKIDIIGIIERLNNGEVISTFSLGGYKSEYRVKQED